MRGPGFPFGPDGVTSGGPTWERISVSHVFDVWFAPQTNCEGYTSLPVTALGPLVFGVRFALQTICEGCNSLPVTTFWPFYVTRK